MADESTTQTVEVPGPRPLESLSPTQYEKWRTTGEIPEEGPGEKKEDAPAQPAPKREAKKESSPGKLGYADLRRRVRELEAENEQLRAPAAPPETREEPAAAKPQTTERAKPQPADRDKDGKAKYASYEEYLEDLADWKAEQRLKVYESEQAEKQRAAGVARENRRIEQFWNERVDKARARYQDFDAALDPKNGPAADIAPGSVVDQWILQSPQGADLLYFFSQNRADLRRLARLHPVDAARELAAIEAAMEDERHAQKTARTTKAPPPSREIGGRGTAAVDDVTKAVADDDVGGYIAAMNRREIARKK